MTKFTCLSVLVESLDAWLSMESCRLVCVVGCLTRFKSMLVFLGIESGRILHILRVSCRSVLCKSLLREQFKYSLLLVLCNRLMTVLVAGGMLVAGGQDLGPVAPPQAYAAVSVSNVVATFCQYEALKHVSFPVQTLGKCAKMIPVMIWGTVIMRKDIIQKIMELLRW